MNIFQLYMGNNFIFWQLDNIVFMIIIWLLVRNNGNMSSGMVKGAISLAFLKSLLPPVIPILHLSNLQGSGFTGYYLDTIVVTSVQGKPSQYISYSWILLLGLLALFLIWQIFMVLILLRRQVSIRLINAHLPRKIFLVTTPLQHSPFVVGIGKYFIFVPVNFEKWTDEQKQLVIAHEMGHIANGDPIVTFLLIPVMLINALNPFFWLLWRQYRHLTEIDADIKAAKFLKLSRRKYAQTLLDTVERILKESRPFIIQTGLFDDYSAIRDRIVLLVTEKKETHKMRKLLFTILIAATFGMFLFIACNRDNSGGKGVQPEGQTIVAQEASGDIYPFDQLTVKPELKDNTPLQNTGEVIENYNLSGMIILKLIIDETGKVEKAEAMKVDLQSITEIQPELEKANIEKAVALAIEKAKELEFSPAEIDGKPVKTSMFVPIQYKAK